MKAVQPVPPGGEDPTRMLRSGKTLRAGRHLRAIAWTMLAAGAALGSGRGATNEATAAALEPVRFEQRIGARLPLDCEVRDATGATHRLRTYFRNRPIILLLGYARCPRLCSVLATSVVDSLQHLIPSAGTDFDVVYFSIDPTDTPHELAALQRRDVRRYGRKQAASGWHVVTADATTIERVARVTGYHFTYDPRSKLYAHPTGFLVLTPSGVISQYFLGIDFNPKDVATALRRAAAGQTGTSVFDLLIRCMCGDGISGRYGPLIWGILQAGVIATVGAVGGGIGWMLWNERKRRRASAHEEAVG